MKEFLKSMWQQCRDLFKTLVRGTSNLVIALAVPVVVIACDFFGIIGGGLLGMAVLAAILLVLSIAFVVAGMPRVAQHKFLVIMARHGFWVDLALTVILTVCGFGMGVTMGLTAMAMGLNISLMTSMIRLVIAMTDREFRSEYFGYGKAKAKSFGASHKTTFSVDAAAVAA